MSMNILRKLISNFKAPFKVIIIIFMHQKAKNIFFSQPKNNLYKVYGKFFFSFYAVITTVA